MDNAATRRALWRCTVQGFLRIRSTARFGVLEEDAAVLGLAVGFADAGRYVAEVAGVCLAVRSARTAGADALTALVRGWAGAGRLGRDWLEDMVRTYAGPDAADQLAQACRAAGPAAEPAAATPRSSGAGTPRSGAVAWCDGILTAGFADIVVLAGRDGDEGPAPETMASIEAIADVCHRIPYPQEIPAPLRPWLVRRYLRSGWGSSSSAGREWCRATSARLGSRPPRGIRRIVSVD